MQYIDFHFSIHFILDGSIPLFCACFVLSVREPIFKIQRCFDKDASNSTRVYRKYLEDLDRVESLELDENCHSKELLMNMWMEYHPRLNKEHNSNPSKPCKLYRQNSSPDYFGEVIKLLMGLPTSVFSSCTLKEVTELLSPSVLTGLYDEADSECIKDEDSSACFLIQLKGVIIALEEIQKPKYSPKNFARFYDLVKHSIYLYFGQQDSLSGQARVDLVKADEQDLYFRSITFLLQIIQSQNVQELKTYLLCIPDLQTLHIIKGCNGESVDWRDMKCHTKTAFEQIHGYFQNYYGSGRTLNTTIIISGRDYKSTLRAIRDDDTHKLVLRHSFDLLKLVEILKLDLEVQLGKGFRGLKNYFVDIANFDSNVATADIGFIDNTLNKFKKEIERSKSEVGEKLDKIISCAITVATSEVVTKAYQFALAAVSLSNPIAAITGGGSLEDVLDRAGDLAGAMANFVKATSLKLAIKDMLDKTEDVGRKLNANRHFLSKVKTLLDAVMNNEMISPEDFEKKKLSFLSHYNAYNPGVTKPELIEMLSYWDAVVTEACKVIDEGTGVVAGGIRSDVNNQGLCWKVPIAITELSTTYEEIYDYQFQLMDAFASYMRSMTSKNAADNIGKDFGNMTTQNLTQDMLTKNLEFMAAYSHILYRLQSLTVAEEYCNFLEYTEGGRRPSICRGIETSITELLSYQRQKCFVRNSGYADIPTKPAHKDDRAFLNLTDLIAGKSVSFQVPNATWLLNSSWIRQPDFTSKIYLQSVDLILPIQSRHTHRPSISIEISGRNRLSDESKQDFVIIPKRKFRFDYSEGPEPCGRNTRLKNPYHICEDMSMGNLCRLAGNQDSDPTEAYPSILTAWKVTVDGYQECRVPIPVTYLPVKVFVEYCVISDDNQLDVHAERDERAIPTSYTCCYGNTYYSWKDDVCTQCPSGSTSKLNGYYCGRD